MKKYNAAIYLRISKEDREINNSIDIQKEITTKYAKEHNYNITKEYIDNGYSGMLSSRPALNNLMIDIIRNKINMVIVKDMSRLTRDKNLTSYYTDIFFPDNNVRLISITEYIDTGERYEIDDVVALRGIVNQSYLEDISRKIKAVKRNFKEHGEFIEASVAYGYKKDKLDKHKLVIDEECSKNVRRIFDLYLEGTALSQISCTFNDEHIPTPSQISGTGRNVCTIWKPSSIKHILKNEVYIGNMVQEKCKRINYKLKKRIKNDKSEWIRVENTHDPIIDKEKFYAVQDILASKSETRVKSRNLLLKGLVVCSDCGKKMGITTHSSDTIYMRCHTYAILPKQKLCTPHNINYQKLENAVISEIQNICHQYLDKKKMKQIIDTKYEELEKSQEISKQKSLLAKSIEVLDFQIEKLYEDKLNGLINNNDFSRMYYKKVKEREESQNKLKELNEIKFEKQTIDYEKVMNEFLEKDNITAYMLNSLIEKIEVDNNKQATIYYKFSDLNKLSKVS